MGTQGTQGLIGLTSSTSGIVTPPLPISITLSHAHPLPSVRIPPPPRSSAPTSHSPPGSLPPSSPPHLLCNLIEILTRVWNLGLILTLSLSLMSLCSDLFFTFYPPLICAPILVRNPPAFHLNCFSISERTSPLLVFSLHIHFNLIPRDALNTLSYGRKIYLFSQVTEGTLYCTDIPPPSLAAIVLFYISLPLAFFSSLSWRSRAVCRL